MYAMKYNKWRSSSNGTWSTKHGKLSHRKGTEVTIRRKLYEHIDNIDLVSKIYVDLNKFYMKNSVNREILWIRHIMTHTSVLFPIC